MTSKPNTNLILAIETSCDETAISAVQGFEIKSHRVHSQADLHAEFGGVFPMLAKREHGMNFIPVLNSVFQDIFGNIFGDALEKAAEAGKNNSPQIFTNVPAGKCERITAILSREEALGPTLLTYLNSIDDNTFQLIKNSFSAICITIGPGLEPALWVGLSAAKALCIAFDLPLYPINHMEGHIASVIVDASSDQNAIGQNQNIQFPAIALLISGGHTELVRINAWHEYEILGKTVDDAVGEAYDKVARILGLPYPGGPQISRLADAYRDENKIRSEETTLFTLPRPMIHSKDFNFSFSGLKTASLYASRDFIQKFGREMNDAEKRAFAYEFEEAVIEVLISKTKKAIEQTGAKSLLIGGGVIANTQIRKSFAGLAQEIGIELFIPEKNLTTDNATMIAYVANLQITGSKKGIMPDDADFDSLRVDGNLSL